MAGSRPYDLAEVVRLTKAKKTAAEIAEHLGVSTRSIERAREAAKLSQSKNLPPFEERLAIAQRIYEDGGTLWHAETQARIGRDHLRKLFPEWEPWSKSQAGQIAHVWMLVAQLPDHLP
jgi:predicted transcriptional regulator